MRTYAYGFPRLGKNREYKRLLEGFWSKKIAESELTAGLEKLDSERLNTYQEYVDDFPVGEMTFYDHMLDTAIMVGLYKADNLNEYYNLCRGKDALALTKWFNTNYHYLVPQIPSSFKPGDFKLKKADQLKKIGIPYLIGPFTFLKLCKGINSANFLDYLLSLASVYRKILKDFSSVHIDEPAFVLRLTPNEITWIKKAYAQIGNNDCRISLFTYYEAVDNLVDLYELPVAAIALDFIHGERNLKEGLKRYGFPKDKTLIAGIVNGRNVWKTDISKTISNLRELSKYTQDLVISTSCPLYHLPITKEGEELDARLLEKIAFAKERLSELRLIAAIFEGREKEPQEQPLSHLGGGTGFGLNPEVRQRVRNLKEEDFCKSLSYEQRHNIQKQILNLPLMPSTTIGSFPQTQELRKKRQDYKKGRIKEVDYDAFIKEKISHLVKAEEDSGLDVLVHGEFERTDMVEFFAQKLNGIATTMNGWIISYGSRVYRPPLIYGDVYRDKPMTVKEIAFCQGLTKRPVKGMLTGPITIIAWSYAREDTSIEEVAYQIALCLADEIRDYEKAGIKIVQIDEPAFREKAPIKRRDWDEYFSWAIKSFNLASNTDPKTQIHTHMCYSEFGEILKYILALDFDVISIEAARSKGEIVEDFKRLKFRRQIGLGVWDIHSPAVPQVAEIKETLHRALKVFSKENFWINPDCGLKTRDWPEVNAGLANMIKAAEDLRRDAAG